MSSAADSSAQVRTEAWRGGFISTEVIVGLDKKSHLGRVLGTAATRRWPRSALEGERGSKDYRPVCSKELTRGEGLNP